jgi:hypothetical protein
VTVGDTPGVIFLETGGWSSAGPRLRTLIRVVARFCARDRDAAAAASFVSLPLCHAVARHGLEFGGRRGAVEVEPKQMVRRVFTLMDHRD